LLLPAAKGANERPPPGLDADPATALGAAPAPAAIASVAYLQTPAILRVVYQRAAVAHEGRDGLKKVLCLLGQRRKGWFFSTWRRQL